MVTVRIADEDVELDAGECLLDADDRAGLPIIFGCRGGACGTCLVEVLSGAENLSELTAEEEILLPVLAPGGTNLRLACQVRVLGPAHLRQKEILF